MPTTASQGNAGARIQQGPPASFLGKFFNANESEVTVAPYKVRLGDTASEIAFDHDIPLEELQRLNPGVQLPRIEVGQILTVPIAPARGSVAAPASDKGTRYRVKAGDTIEAVAASHKVDVQAIVALNKQITKRPWLLIGEFLEIPVPVKSATRTPVSSPSLPGAPNLASSPSLPGAPKLVSSQSVLDMPILALMTPLLEGLFVVAAAVALVRTLLSLVKGRNPSPAFAAIPKPAALSSALPSGGKPSSLPAIFQKLSAIVASLVASVVAAITSLLPSAKTKAAAPVRGPAADSGVRSLGKTTPDSQPGGAIAIGYGTHDSNDVVMSANRAVTTALSDLKSAPPAVIFVAADPGQGATDAQYVHKAMQAVSKAVPVGTRVFGLPATRVGGAGVDVMALSTSGGLLALCEPLRKSGSDAAIGHNVSFWDASKLKAAIYHVVPQTSLEQVIMTQLPKVPLFGITGKPTNVQGTPVLGYNESREIVPSIFVFGILKSSQYGGAFVATVLSQWMYGKDSLLAARPYPAESPAPTSAPA